MTTPASTDRRDLDLTGITAVEVATFGGELRVITGDERPRMEATVYGNATYSVERVGALLYIVGKKRGFFYSGNGVGMRLWLPAQLALKLANVSAAIRVRGDMRLLSASVVHGDIEVRASNPAETKLRVVHGRALVHGVTSAFDISATPGDVRMVNSGGALHIAATPGNVRLEQVTLAPGKSHDITTASGDIEIDGIHAPSGLDVRGQSKILPITAELLGADVRVKGRNLRAWRDGPKPVVFYLYSAGRLSVKG